MKVLTANGVAHHWREDRDREGQPVVFANSLGTDLRLWDTILPLLPTGLRLIRYDIRGHWLSECPQGPYLMDDLFSDLEGLLEQLDMRSVIFVGLSIGGMIGLALATRRPDLVRGVSNDPGGWPSNLRRGASRLRAYSLTLSRGHTHA
jgi:3-oxoadipate enol-lactonase